MMGIVLVGGGTLYFLLTQRGPRPPSEIEQVVPRSSEAPPKPAAPSAERTAAIEPPEREADKAKPGATPEQRPDNSTQAKLPAVGPGGSDKQDMPKEPDAPVQDARPRPPQAPSLTAAQQERLKERDQLWASSQELRAAGKLAEAIASAEKMLAIGREVFGDFHPEVAGSLAFVAEMYEEKEDFAAARKARQEPLAGHGCTAGTRSRGSVSPDGAG
jgi:hypothetical protein